MRGWPLALVATVGVVAAVAVAAIVLVAGSGGTSVFDLEVGDCFDLPVGGDEVDVDTVDLIECDEPHEAEVVAVGRLNRELDRPYPDDDQLFAEVDRGCAAAAGPLDDRFGIVPIAPNEASWEPFEGGFVCVAVPFGGGPVTGSIGAG
jgi:hypothetical protein